MHEDAHLTAAETELERALRRLMPADSGLDRDRVMFRAGQAAGRRGSRPWQAAATGLAAALVLAVTLSTWRAGGPPVPGGPVIVHQTPSADEIPSPAAMPGVAYLRLRAAVLHEGLDALPTVKSAEQATPIREALMPGA